MQHTPESIDVFQIEDAVWIAESKIRSPNYDFAFEQLMACRRSRFGADEVVAVGRFGAVEDYDLLHAGLLELGVRLVHSPEQHALCSELPRWYPLLQGLTPESWWFDQAPDAETAGELAGRCSSKAADRPAVIKPSYPSSTARTSIARPWRPLRRIACCTGSRW